ncbi:hypothetical protein L6452_17361 [Arctium lappa]|uniref:Uncharacterized protein n=1 Tax=Arctium lappa TaxID=4217 RepID=A0ACB9C3C5_ARCLA|nr:hypothetical protein L6452_17361 [Arctium lappa]
MALLEALAGGEDRFLVWEIDRSLDLAWWWMSTLLKFIREELYAGMGSENISSDSVADRITMDCNVDEEDLIMEDDIFDNIFDDGDVELEVDVDGEDLELAVGDCLQSHDDRC